MKKIIINTLRNGYELIVDDCEYMYLSEKDLVEGVFIHIGLKIKNYMDKSDIASLVEVCKRYSLSENLLELSRLQKRVSILTEEKSLCADTNKRLQSKVSSLTTTLENWKKKYKTLKSKENG